MAYKDIFPTRDGVPSGTANERQMLDAINDTQSFRTRIEGNTMLRTKGGMPQFTTIAGGSSGTELEAPELTCKFFLNSGIVDMHAGGPLSPQIVDQGNIYRTDHVTEVGAGVGVGKMQINIDKTGKLTYLLTDAPATDGVIARSFTNEAGDYTGKKVVAFRVPSSIFTGRTRLYAQSLYGGINKTIKLSVGGVGRPALSITTQAQEDANIPAITIGTGTGLYYDKADHSHWLIFPSTESAYIIRLKTNFCAERLRNKLADTALSADELERIEVYILSHSIPDLNYPAQEVFYDPTPSESMGYSWHWNWDGNTCDLVDVVEKLVEPGIYGFESTHYRLAFTRAHDGHFEVVRTIEGGPSLWSVPKNINVIAYPDWISGTLIKAGNLPSGVSTHSQNGLVYCFYAKNELKLVTYSGTFTNHASSRTSSPEYFGGLEWTSPLGLILNAFESGTTSGNNAWDGMTHTFACDGATVGGANGVNLGDSVEANWAGRTVGELIGTYEVSGVVDPIRFGVPTFSTTNDGAGTPAIAPGTKMWPSSFAPVPGSYVYTYATYDGYTFQREDFTEIKGAFSLVVIPFMDAQAVYMQGSTVRHRVGDRITGTRNVPPVTPSHWRWEYPSSPPVIGPTYDTYNAQQLNPSGEPDSTTAPFDEVTTTDQPCTLISSHGTFSATPPDISPFYSALSAVEQNWGTISSANGVVRSEVNGVEVGSPIFPAFYSLVGWA